MSNDLQVLCRRSAPSCTLCVKGHALASASSSSACMLLLRVRLLLQGMFWGVAAPTWPISQRPLVYRTLLSRSVLPVILMSSADAGHHRLVNAFAAQPPAPHVTPCHFHRHSGVTSWRQEKAVQDDIVHAWAASWPMHTHKQANGGFWHNSGEEI